MADVVAVGQQVGGERMAEGVASDSPGQSGLSRSLIDRLLDERFVDVVSSLLAGLRVRPAMLLREHELPTPLPVGVGILAGQGVRSFDAAVPMGQVLLMNGLDA